MTVNKKAVRGSIRPLSPWDKHRLPDQQTDGTSELRPNVLSSNRTLREASSRASLCLCGDEGKATGLGDQDPTLTKILQAQKTCGTYFQLEEEF